MENYQIGINFKNTNYSVMNYKKGINVLNYNAVQNKQKYINNSGAMLSYNDFIKNIPRGSHIGRYEPPK